MASSINASTSGSGGVITTADNSGILNLQTAGTNALTVNANGTVSIATKLLSPNQPVFKAMLTSNGDQTFTNQVLPFNQQVINNGGGTFNTSAYSYTVPVAGVYFVACATYGTSSAGNATMYNQIRKNGSDAVIGTNGDIYIGSAAANVTIAPILAYGILSLAANDVLTVYGGAYNGSSVYRVYTGNSEFIAFLLG